MYLTKLAIEDARLVADFYQLHGFIYSLFPEQVKYTDRSDPDSGAILYRLERGRIPYALIQSKVAPLWGETKIVSISPKPTDQFWFRLRANVTMRRNSDRRRLGILDMDGQTAWLQQKSLSCGFDLLTVSITDRPGIVYSRRDGAIVAITPVTFEGMLQVRDSVAFDRTIRAGVGSGKSFGCGLLSLA